MDNASADPSFLGSIPSQNIRIIDRGTLPSDAFLAPPRHRTTASNAYPYSSDAVVPHAVVVTGLPADGVTEEDVRQYMTFCGSVEAVHLFPPPPPCTTATTAAAAAAPSTSAALVFFRDASSAAYAELLSGGLFQGKKICVRHSTAVEAEGRTLVLDNEPTAAEDGRRLAGAAGATAGEAADIPETRTGLWVRAHMHRAAQAVRAKTARLMQGAEEGAAKARHGALSLELKAAHAVADLRNPRDRVPVYGNGLTGKQYDHTPTQPQWGEAPVWQRAYVTSEHQSADQAHAEAGKTL